MIRPLIVALTLLILPVATGCSGSSSAGAVPQTAQVLQPAPLPAAHMRRPTDTIGGFSVTVSNPALCKHCKNSKLH